jgi:hypothetical protein
MQYVVRVLNKEATKNVVSREENGKTNAEAHGDDIFEFCSFTFSPSSPFHGYEPTYWDLRIIRCRDDSLPLLPLALLFWLCVGAVPARRPFSLCYSCMGHIYHNAHTDEHAVLACVPTGIYKTPLSINPSCIPLPASSSHTGTVMLFL